MQEFLALAMRGTFFAGTRVRTQDSPGAPFCLRNQAFLSHIDRFTPRTARVACLHNSVRDPPTKYDIFCIFQRSPFLSSFSSLQSHGMHSLSSDLYFCSVRFIDRFTCA